MKTKSVPGGWLQRDGRRLDCGPYLSGALEARVQLERHRTTSLEDLTLGGLAGIFHAGRIKRLWVDDEKYGRRFLSSTDILQADLSNLPLISHKAVAENPKLLLSPGWTLITRSGTVGRMAYARPDMDGLACSEHVLRVVPDPEKIPPGYLYAYLSSKFGVPLVVGGTYGAIIQHIEPEHVADLPVPRFGAAFEWQIHELVERAAVLRVLAARSLCEVASRFDQIISKVSLDHPSPRIASVPASSTQARLDAQYHDPVAEQVRAALHQGRHTTVGGWCSRVFLPGIFKRIHIDDPAYGAPYYTGATLFWLEPQAKGILSRRSTLFEAVSLRKGTILLQAFGQEGGLTGRSVWVGQHLDGATSTHMLVRLAASTEEDTAYLFGFLQSKTAYLQIAVLPYGGSIPHFDEAGVSGVVVPVLDTHERTQLSAQVLSAVNARDEALMADRRARALLEDAIAKGSS